jgi:hypothetical protein
MATTQEQLNVLHRGARESAELSRAQRFKLILFLASILQSLAPAQDTQFLPELDGHLTLNSSFKVYVQAKDDREGGDPQQFTFGPALQFYRKPLIKLKNASIFDLDDAKSRLLGFESGYRIITAPDAPVKNRAIEDITFRFPFQGRVLLADKNRADLDWQNGNFFWRYRNKLTVQRTFTIRAFHLIPYVAAEPFYESRYNKWSATDLYAGSLFPVGSHFQFDCYYQHENDTGKHPNQQEEFIGLALHLYLSREKNPRPGPLQKVLPNGGAKSGGNISSTGLLLRERAYSNRHVSPVVKPIG